MLYTFHVVGLPHTQTTTDYNCCAYTGKVTRFCKMMLGLGHTVHLYGSQDNTAECSSFTPCYPKRWHPRNYDQAPFDPAAEHWLTMNGLAIEGIKRNQQPHDFLCLIAGRCQQQIAQAFPEMLAVEFGVGYSGTFSRFRVFESTPWQHMVYGASAPDPFMVDGNFYDTVIPNYYDPENFPPAPARGDYYLYMGRLIDRKGWRIAQDVCRTLGHRLLVAGQGIFDGYGEYIGIVDDEDKAYYLAKAKAVFCPSLFVEPFCGVMAEAMLCGTPVISTPWGSFAENNLEGITGFKCHSMRQFLRAAENVHLLNPDVIRRHAIRRFSMDVVAQKYQVYFDHLFDLWGKGWDQ